MNAVVHDVVDRCQCWQCLGVRRAIRSGSGARSAPHRKDGRPLLVKGTLNGNSRFHVDDLPVVDLSPWMPLPLGLYQGGAECDAMNWEPVSLYEDGASWTVTKKWFSCGVVEVSAHLGVSSKKKRDSSTGMSVALKDSRSLEEIEMRFLQSLRRSRKLLRERLFECDADHMVTLGKRGKFASLDAFWLAWDKFNRGMRAYAVRVGRRWRAVCVPELHADGETWHGHVGVNGFWPHTVLWFEWQKALGGRGGEHGKESIGSVRIDYIKVKRRKSLPRGAVARRVAGYLGKYLGKGFSGCNRSRRLFAASRGLAPYRVERFKCHHRTGVPQLGFALLGRLHAVGAGSRASVRRWDRVGLDGRLLRCGFFFSTEWSGVDHENSCQAS